MKNLCATLLLTSLCCLPTAHAEEVGKVSTTFRTGAAGTALAASGDYDTTNFAWNLGAGVGYSLTDHIIVDLGYRYTSFGDAKKYTSGTLNFQAKDLDSHEALLGLRYQF